MSTARTPVIAAIPNYNMADSLSGLIPELLEQDYTRIVVLDDASSDHSVDVVQQFGRDVTLVRGGQNIGAGANRNRILSVDGLERYGSAVIHFMDADVKPATTQTSEIISEIMQPDIGVVGGLIQLPDGTPYVWNYGPSVSGPLKALWSYGTGAVQQASETIRPKSTDQARRLRRICNVLLKDWPDTTDRQPAARDVFWVVEANMMIGRDIFERVGGFDPRLRYHEAQDLAMKLAQNGLRRRFDPSVVVTHPPLEAYLNWQTRREELRGLSHLIMKYSVVPAFNSLYNKVREAKADKSEN